MNRIILIGNGFDLAHGMKTSYNHFLDDLWNNITAKATKSSSRSPEYFSFENDLIHIYGTKHFGDLYSYDENKSGFDRFLGFTREHGFKYEIKNAFLKKITDSIRLKNWVDLENEYYRQLIDIAKDDKDSDRINYLNTEFRRIQELLEEYLNRQQKEFTELNNESNLLNEIGSKIYAPINYSDFTESAVNKTIDEEYSALHINAGTLLSHPAFARENIDDKQINIVERFGFDESSSQSTKIELRNLLHGDNAGDYFELTPEKVLFLNFNYTHIDELYNNPKVFKNYNPAVQISVETIRIHGSLRQTDNNPIIFGYGDEIDDNYLEIEKLNDNRYLENIKSIKYLETDNYKRLLEFINADDYQVFLFGHSCGVSDRTLLNTLFEHPNCVSIKPFYHKKDDKNDNYSDLVRNISRNFNNKAEMRSKVVNKTYCEPLVKLPQ